MKLLLVDDEAHVREGIRLILDAEKFGIDRILEAENGLEAIRILEKEHPEIMILDMQMPTMDGVELIAQLKKRNIAVQVIVVSGYSDFNYTRAAILAHGVDYLLKPFKKDELENAVINAINAAKGADRSSEASKGEGSGDGRVFFEKSILQWIRGEIGGQNEIIASFGQFGASCDQVMISAILPQNAQKVTNDLYKNDGEAFLYVVRNIFNDIMASYRAKEIFFLDRHQYIAMVSYGGSDGETSEYLNKIRQFQRMLKKEIALATLSSDEVITGKIGELPQITKKAIGSTLSCNVLKDGERIKSNTSIPRLMDMEFLLYSAIKEGNHEFLYKLFAEYKQKLVDRGYLTLGELQICTAEANLLYAKLVNENMQIANSKRHSSLISPWISDVDLWCEKLVQLFGSIIDQHTAHIDIAQKVREYISMYYSDNITLLLLSKKFFLSPQYISKTYKEKYGSTIMNDLTTIRIEKAIELVGNSNMTLSEIALSTGYDDENYFSKVFKRRVGYSPQIYRKKGKIQKNNFM
jgi:two-component system response regulator YesN